MTPIRASILLLALFGGGCTATTPRLMSDCPTTAESASVPRTPVALDFKAVAGDAPFAIGKSERSRDGSEYRVTKFRFYLSGATLVDRQNATVSAPLGDATGRALPYGVALVDYTRPETLRLSVLAPRGDYKALNLVVGVPDTCANGEPLAHGDAAARVAPLDVDSDMYWSWNPGYVSLKIEGQVRVDGAWKAFFYHVGEDSRRAKLHVHVPLHVGADASPRANLVLDVNRLFVSPAGEDSPRLEAGRVHGGALTDQMALNMAKSGFVSAAK